MSWGPSSTEVFPLPEPWYDCVCTLVIRARRRWALLFLIISCFCCSLIPGGLQSALPLCDRQSWLLPPPPPPPRPPPPLCSGLMMLCHAGASSHCRRLLLLTDPKFKLQSSQLSFKNYFSALICLIGSTWQCLKHISHLSAKLLHNFYCGLQDSSSGRGSIVSLTMHRCIVRHIVENGYLETPLWYLQVDHRSHNRTVELCLSL